MNLKTENKQILWNSIVGVLNRVITVILGIVFRKIFIVYLGESLSGLSSLYMNILNFLSIATAGLGVSAMHKIYVCNANEDYEEVRKVEQFTKQFYRAVTIVIFLIGLVFTTILDKMIYNNQYDISFLRMVFLLQVLGECINYWFQSKKIILQAYAENYIISYIEIVVNVCMYVLQGCVIILTQNYILYLFTLLLKGALIGGLSHWQAVKKHPWLKNSVKVKMREMSYLFKDLKHTILMQFSTFIFISTDSIVISKFLGLVWVNVYDNYMIVLNALTSAMDEINAAIRSTFGNILAKDESQKARVEFVESTTFVQFLLASFGSVSVFCLIGDFIQIWLGSKFVLAWTTALVFTINFYITVIASPLKNYMIISGNFAVDKKITISAAFVNIIISVILVGNIGVVGVILGTMSGNICMLIARMIYFYKNIVQQGLGKYVGNICLYAGIFGIELVITMKACEMVIFSNIYIAFIIKIIFCLLIPNVINLIIFRNRKELKLLTNKLKNKRDA